MAKATKAPKTANPVTDNKATDADAIREDIVDSLVAVAGQTAQAEFAVWRTMAELAELGALSVRGFKAHLEQAEARGALFATIKSSHGQHLVAMLMLSRLPNAPQAVAPLFTLADVSGRVAPKIEGQSKSETVRKTIEQAQTKGTTFEALAKRVNALKPATATRQPRPNQGGKSSGVKTVTLDTQTVVTLSKIVTAQFQAKAELSADMLEAMRDLSVALDNLLSAHEDI